MDARDKLSGNSLRCRWAWLTFQIDEFGRWGQGANEPGRTPAASGRARSCRAGSTWRIRFASTGPISPTARWLPRLHYESGCRGQASRQVVWRVMLLRPQDREALQDLAAYRSLPRISTETNETLKETDRGSRPGTSRHSGAAGCAPLFSSGSTRRKPAPLLNSCREVSRLVRWQ